MVRVGRYLTSRKPMIFRPLPGFRFTTMVVRAGRIELPSAAWKAAILPLNHARIISLSTACAPARTRILQILYTLRIAKRYTQGFLVLNKTVGLSAACAPARTRTQNNGSEDRCDIHFTTGALMHHHTLFSAMVQILSHIL